MPDGGIIDNKLIVRDVWLDFDVPGYVSELVPPKSRVVAG